MIAVINGHSMCFLLSQGSQQAEGDCAFVDPTPFFSVSQWSSITTTERQSGSGQLAVSILQNRRVTWHFMAHSMVWQLATVCNGSAFLAQLGCYTNVTIKENGWSRKAGN